MGGIASFQCNFDGSGFSLCTSPFNNTQLAEGLHSLEVKVINNVGVESKSVKVEWTVDTIPPTIELTNTPQSPTPLSNATFDFLVQDSGSGVVTVECQLNGAGYVACEKMNQQIFAQLEERNHQFQIRSRDRAGNISSPTSYS